MDGGATTVDWEADANHQSKTSEQVIKGSCGMLGMVLLVAKALRLL
jgi:hypothetical protein